MLALICVELVSIEWSGIFLPALPPEPAIAAPPGVPPSATIAFREFALVSGTYRPAGSGFFLELPDGEIVGVTAGHTLPRFDGFPSVEFRRPGAGTAAMRFSRTRGAPGRWWEGGPHDYLLLRPDAVPDPEWVARPDPRGGPQFGERVIIVSAQRTPGVWPGTVESFESGIAWVRMDGGFDTHLVSGAPVISRHTGKVVGIACWRRSRAGTVWLGVNPARNFIPAT